MEPLPDCLEALPLQRAVVERFRASLAPLAEVEGAYVSGSIARGEATPASDVDLVLVAADDACREVLVARARDLFGQLGDVLTVTPAIHVKPSLWLGVLRGPVLVDIDLLTWLELEASPWLRDIMVVRDNCGRLERLREQSRYLSGTPYDSAWLTGLSERWWRWAFYCIKDNRRADHLLVLGNYNFLRSNAFNHLFAVLDGVPREYAGRRQDGSRAARLAAILAEPGSSREEWDRTLLRLHEYFIELREQVLQLIPHPVPANEPDLQAELMRYIFGRQGGTARRYTPAP